MILFAKHIMVCNSIISTTIKVSKCTMEHQKLTSNRRKNTSKHFSRTNRLLENSEMFQYEELLIERNDNYRYIVCGNYKIIYSVDIEEQLIKIADVFDTRQNPIKIKRNK